MNHPSSRPLLMLALLWAAFSGFVWFTAGELPDRVATHFGANGAPNGWMTRAEHVRFTLAAGLLVPAFMIGLFWLIRRLQGAGLNVPRRDYWLAPERREETLAFIQRQGFRIAGLFVLFLAGIHWSIVQTNLQSPIHLQASHVGWISGSFAAAIAVWIVCFFRYFFRKSA